ncbi:radiation-inducible immediate-early gene IEX-1 [Hemicordylus capensis]|uniref:radiation-inducible immediate-early gene IEX-1 n=1 Tax=Hemicordylus capensis TaxID=884348 RepID=UPI002302CA3E|nr:radiation-inducible immediate-early gene IEX-1 [Hemicordylus capensis]
MNTLYSTSTSMCYAYEPRLSALKMPKIPSRTVPTGPQYFTFDPLPEAEKSPAYRNFSKTSKIKKRSRRVLYPPVVKRYYPTEEPSYAKRLLFALLLVIFFQVYSAEEDLLLTVAIPATEENASHCSVEGVSGSHCEALLQEQPITTSFSVEIQEVANASSWHWEDEAASEAAVDITQFLEQSLAAF